MKRIDPHDAWETSLILYCFPSCIEAIGFANEMV
jgi:hypothetical protein